MTEDKFKWDRGIKSCDYCSTVKAPNCRHYRHGKTRIERAAGLAQTRYENMDARTSWLNQSSQNRDNRDFPRHACNGKKNRFFK
jgi:hypothetical protein